MGKILVIDDDPTYCRLVSTYLTRAGYEVTSTDDGEVAIRLVSRGGIDLVLLDLSMPKMNGEIFLEVLRTDKARQSTPVIVVTATIDGDAFRRCEALGIQGAIDKTTLKYPEVVEAVNAFLSNK